MKKIVIILICIITFISTAKSAFDVSDFAARPTSMGDAFVGLADDASAPLYNPAGIVQLKQIEFHSTYSLLYPGLDINNTSQMYLSLVLPVKEKNAFGLSYFNLMLSDLYQENIIQLSYARKLNAFWYLFGKNLRKNEFYMGANVKLLRRGYTVDDKMALDPLFSGYKDPSMDITFDVGLMIRIFSQELKNFYNIGLSVLNLTQPDIGLKSEDRVPLEARLGASLPLKEYAFMQKISMSHPMFVVGMGYRNNDINFNFGWENAFLNEVLFFRLGSTMFELTTGLGFQFKFKPKYNLFIDYAFAYPYKIEESLGKHTVSLRFRF
ncbi:MAG: hypothetical protein JW827_05385 [Spirochaetes bacterium]|nr:hypothetical protein [Spirochaetota bacterium]